MGGKGEARGGHGSGSLYTGAEFGLGLNAVLEFFLGHLEALASPFYFLLQLTLRLGAG